MHSLLLVFVFASADICSKDWTSNVNQNSLSVWPNRSHSSLRPNGSFAWIFWCYSTVFQCRILVYLITWCSLTVEFSFCGSYSCSFGAFHTGLIFCSDPFLVYLVHVQSISNSFSIIFFSMPLQPTFKTSIDSFHPAWALHQYWTQSLQLFIGFIVHFFLYNGFKMLQINTSSHLLQGASNLHQPFLGVEGFLSSMSLIHT